MTLNQTPPHENFLRTPLARPHKFANYLSFNPVW